MKVTRLLLFVLFAAALLVMASGLFEKTDPRQQVPADRQEVIFWHFWGGADRDVVEEVVRRFNESQDRHFVRAIAVPGNNLDVKSYLSIVGGEPPDLINQDDPLVADSASHGAILALDELASSAEIEQLKQWLFPAARRLGQYNGRMYALCNGLDIRALYYNRALLKEHGLSPPTTIAELDELSEKLSQRDADGRLQRVGYVPDSRRLWAWGVVFGGEFYDDQNKKVTANGRSIVAALDWMASYGQRYSANEIAAFRQGDQSLPGKPFPLLAGRYALVMDGQWRVRDITKSQQQQRQRGEPVTQFGVCPLPLPPEGRERAGWVNGNFFVVPRGAKNPQGAWEFMKFWSGFGGREAEAAQTSAAGAWIPVSQKVVDQPAFQESLTKQPLLAEFVKLAGSENQFPIPVIPGAPQFDREIRYAGGLAMSDPKQSPRELLQNATRRIQKQLDRRKE